MSTVGQIEKQTQKRVIQLFRERLGYDYLGDKTDLDNRNIEETLLRGWLTFKAKGDIHVFVDECHRTQSGDLHKAMKALLPNAIFIGFTGTPLLKADKAKSVEVFGRYIHTYKFDQAVREGVC